MSMWNSLWLIDQRQAHRLNLNVPAWGQATWTCQCFPFAALEQKPLEPEDCVGQQQGASLHTILDDDPLCGCHASSCHAKSCSKCRMGRCSHRTRPDLVAVGDGRLHTARSVAFEIEGLNVSAKAISRGSRDSRVEAEYNRPWSCAQPCKIDVKAGLAKG